MRREFLIVVLVMASCRSAQNQVPSDNFVSASGLQTEINDGLREKGRLQGLELVDVAQRFAAAFATANTPSASGYRAIIYTPLAWLKQQASNAAKEYRPFTISDVSDEMRENVLRVVVYPSLPTHIIGKSTNYAHSVQHVVIRDAARRRIVQPIRKDNFTEETQNAFGARLEYRGVSAVFPLDEVEKLRDENEEFFVTVVGDQGERDFKVKRKHLQRLPFARIAPAAVSPPNRTIDTMAEQPVSRQPLSKEDASREAAFYPVTASPGLTSMIEQCVEALKKVDAALRVSASSDVISSALIDAQMRFDEVQRHNDQNNVPLTIESAAFALDGFKRAGKGENTDDLTYSRTALQAAIDNLAAYKSTGRELPPTKALPSQTPQVEKELAEQSKQEVALTPQAPHIDAPVSPLKSHEKPTEAGTTGTVSAVQPTTATAGVTATVTKPNPGRESLGDAATNTTNPARSTGEATAEISSYPLGADIEIDGNFVGSTPSSVGLKSGEHILRVSKIGYKRWERTLTTSTGNVKVAATLEPIPVTAAGTTRAAAEIHQDANPAPSNEPYLSAPSTAISKNDSRPVIAAEASIIRNPEVPASSSAGLAEDMIGVWFTGSPTVRHDGVAIAGVQPRGPADSIEIKPGDVILAMDGHYLFTIDELRAELLRHEPGARLAIRYRHYSLDSDNYLTLRSKDAIPHR